MAVLESSQSALVFPADDTATLSREYLTFVETCFEKVVDVDDSDSARSDQS